MNKQTEFVHYLTFITENFPRSSFQHANEGLSKKLFFNIHDTIAITDIFASIEDINPVCKDLLADHKLIYIKLLYILPTNDDFQFYSIMRANIENLLRILYHKFNPQLDYTKIKETSYSTLNSTLEKTFLKQKFQEELSSMFNFFGNYSRSIHGLSKGKNTVVYLKDMMVQPFNDKEILSKIRSIEELRNIFISVFLDIFRIKSNSFETAQLTRLHSILGERSYSELPIFNNY